MTSVDATLADLRGLEVLKGHGTGNDFVLVPDLQSAYPLTADQVRALTDRHRGIGGDGVLRVARTASRRATASIG